jgi:hypothetical protein
MIRLDGQIATVAIGLAIAFFGGFVATRLRLPALVGYLLAGVAVGPFTPGFVAKVDVAHELAEIGSSCSCSASGSISRCASCRRSSTDRCVKRANAPATPYPDAG